MVLMVEQVMERCGQAPDAWLVDGGYVGHEQIERASQRTVVYGPVPKLKDKTADPHQAKATDSEAVAAWRERMSTDEAKTLYKRRAATANASMPEPQPGLAAVPEAGSGEGQVCDADLCAGAQPDAHAQSGAGIDRERDRTVCCSRNGGLRT